jgi:hypothetical protein
MMLPLPFVRPSGAPSEGKVTHLGTLAIDNPKASKVISSFVPNAKGSPVPAPTKVSPADSGPRTQTVDELLRTCPSQQDMNDIARDFGFQFVAPPCNQNSSEGGALLAFIDTMRVWKLIRFDAPIPLLNATSVYDWLRQTGVRFVITRQDYPTGWDGIVYLSASGLARGGRQWMDYGTPNPWERGGLMLPASSLVHEAWHASRNIVHNCRANTDGVMEGDSDLAYGGAWAAHYWLFRWLEEHSGEYLSPSEKQWAGLRAESVLRALCSPPWTRPLPP